MRSFYKNSKVIIFTLAFFLGLAGPIVALAATSPSLGAVNTFGVASDTFTNSNTAPQTIINGDVCYTTGPVTPPMTTTNAAITPCPPSAGVSQTAALADLNTQVLASCNSLGAGAVNLDNVAGHLTGVYTPGCYTSGGTMNITTGATVTLNGAGTYIFKPGGALTTQNNSFVTLAGGASACDVFWAPVGSTTLGAFTTGGIPPAGPTFIGNIFRGDAAGLSITFGHFANLSGRALAFGSTVTTDANTITVPSACSAPASSGGGSGALALALATPVAPLINVTKIPIPLALPAGPGSVSYSYAVSNIGTVPMSNVIITDNSCSPLAFVSGDTNSNLMLDVTETWNYRCTVTLAQTTTNIVTASGQANGFTAVDTANATVAVGVPLVPPLIHLVKVPNVFVLPYPGGAVTYMYTVTNPGTVPLSNVSIVDNRCTGLPGLVSGNGGDLNQNNLLESNEAWNFACQTYLTQTTTNTATAQGSANGFTVTDSSFATVVVSTPPLPFTGYPPSDKGASWGVIVIPIGVLVILLASYMNRKKQTVGRQL